MSDTVLHISGLRVRRGQRLVADVPEITLRAGEVHAIMGPNGAGKSSVLLSLPLLIPAEWGKYELLGKQVHQSDTLWCRRQIGVVFQAPLLLDGSVLYNTLLGQAMRGIPREDARQNAMRWLGQLGVSGLALHRCSTLSGGEAQRVSIARALCLNPRVLLLDEPFSGLDVMSRLNLMRDIRPVLREAGTAALIVTHDFSEAALLADRITVMEAGRVVQSGTPSEISKNPAGPMVTALVQFARQMSEICRDIQNP